MTSTMVGLMSRARTQAAESQHRPEPPAASLTRGVSRNTAAKP